MRMPKYTFNGVLLSLLIITMATGCTLGSKQKSSTDSSTNTKDTAKNTSIETEDDFLNLEDDTQDTVEVVTEDVYGKDYDFIERYPDSIRSYYESYDGESTVTYQTNDDQEKVREFYNENLNGKDGWELSAESSDYMEYMRSTEKGDEYMSLYLYVYKDQGITEFELVYEPPYTEEDATSIDEPIEVDVE